MLKKLILATALLSIAPTTIVTGPTEFFEIKEEPQAPKPIDILISWLIMAPQNRLYEREIILPGIGVPLLLGSFLGSRKLARGLLSAPVIMASAFLANYLRRVCEDGISKETFVQSLLDTPFSLEFLHSDHPKVILLNTLKYIYLAHEIKTLIFDIENECAEQEIESDITEQLVPPNNNYFVLPTEKALLAMAIHKAIPLLENAAAKWTSFALKYYQSLKRHIIPHTTIALLSPDLQNRCYQLSHRVVALRAFFPVMNFEKSCAAASRANNIGAFIKGALKNKAFVKNEFKLLIDLADKEQRDRLFLIDMHILMEEIMIKNLREDKDVIQAEARETNLTVLMQKHREMHKTIDAGNVDDKQLRLLNRMRELWAENKAQANLTQAAQKFIDDADAEAAALAAANPVDHAAGDDAD